MLLLELLAHIQQPTDVCYMCAKIWSFILQGQSSVFTLKYCTHQRFICVITCIVNSFLLLLSNIPVYDYTTICLSIFLLIWVHVLQLIGVKSAMNIFVQAFFRPVIFISFGKISKNEIARSQGRCRFQYVKKLPNFFPKLSHHFRAMNRILGCSTFSPMHSIISIF